MVRHDRTRAEESAATVAELRAALAAEKMKVAMLEASLGIVKVAF